MARLPVDPSMLRVGLRLRALQLRLELVLELQGSQLADQDHRGQATILTLSHPTKRRAWQTPSATR